MICKWHVHNPNVEKLSKIIMSKTCGLIMFGFLCQDHVTGLIGPTCFNRVAEVKKRIAKPFQWVVCVFFQFSLLALQGINRHCASFGRRHSRFSNELRSAFGPEISRAHRRDGSKKTSPAHVKELSHGICLDGH